MTKVELIKELNNYCQHSVYPGIHLFGIKYANEIKNCNSNAKELVRLSKLADHYSAELSKGIRLSNYVTLKNNI